MTGKKRIKMKKNQHYCTILPIIYDICDTVFLRKGIDDPHIRSTCRLARLLVNHTMVLQSSVEKSSYNTIRNIVLNYKN